MDKAIREAVPKLVALSGAMWGLSMALLRWSEQREALWVTTDGSFQVIIGNSKPPL